MDKPKDHQAATDVYAMLHRVVENGEATDFTWQRLTLVCLELDNKDEAVEAFHKIGDPGLRRGLRRQLAQRGWVSEARDADEIKSLMVTDADLNPTTREKLDDALRFLFEGNMPWYALGGTVAFPVVLGLGGLLTAASDSVVLRILALLPALFVLCMVGALGRHVLRLALEERDDAAGLPAPKQLVGELPGFLLHFTVLALLFLAPGAALILTGMAWLALPVFAAAAWLLPMAGALLLGTGDWRAVAPGPLLAAVRRTGASYRGVATVIALLFAPAAVAFALTVKMPVFLTISVTGPLTVVPYFVAMRMMGLTLYYERKVFEGLFALPAPGASLGAAPTGKAVAGSTAAPATGTDAETTTGTAAETAAAAVAETGSEQESGGSADPAKAD